MLAALLAGAVGFSGGAHAERALEVSINLLNIGKSLFDLLPFAFFSVFCLSSCSASSVIVCYDLVSLDIPFTWHEQVGSCILKHRYKERQHIALGIHVLYRLEETGSLPVPYLRATVVEVSVALPQGYVAAAQTFCIFLSTITCNEVFPLRRLRCPVE